MRADVDLNWGLHRERQMLENYEFLIETGLSHDLAVKQLGIGERGWRRMRDARRAREAHARRGERE